MNHTPSKCYKTRHCRHSSAKRCLAHIIPGAALSSIYLATFSAALKEWKFSKLQQERLQGTIYLQTYTILKIMVNPNTTAKKGNSYRRHPGRDIHRRVTLLNWPMRLFQKFKTEEKWHPLKLKNIVVKVKTQFLQWNTGVYNACKPGKVRYWLNKQQIKDTPCALPNSSCRLQRNTISTSWRIQFQSTHHIRCPHNLLGRLLQWRCTYYCSGALSMLTNPI